MLLSWIKPTWPCVCVCVGLAESRASTLLPAPDSSPPTEPSNGLVCSSPKGLPAPFPQACNTVSFLRQSQKGDHSLSLRHWGFGEEPGFSWEAMPVRCPHTIQRGLSGNSSAISKGIPPQQCHPMQEVVWEGEQKCTVLASERGLREVFDFPGLPRATEK